MPNGVIARLDRLVDFRDPLGPAAKHFLSRLRTAYLVESARSRRTAGARKPARLFSDAGRHAAITAAWFRGGRQGEAGPLALKRELAPARSRSRAARTHRAGTASRTDAPGSGNRRKRSSSLASGDRAARGSRKSLVAATHQRDQARTEFRRVEQQLGAEREEIARLHQEAEAARARAARGASRTCRSACARARQRKRKRRRRTSGSPKLRHDFHSLQERVVAQREELATMAERLASAEAHEQRLTEEIAKSDERVHSLRQQHDGAVSGEEPTSKLPASSSRCRWKTLRAEKNRTRGIEGGAGKRMGGGARARRPDRGSAARHGASRSTNCAPNAASAQIEKARNDADRDYLRQTCVAELNAQPEELMAQECRSCWSAKIWSPRKRITTK